ncbi:hypothetical protein BH10PLA1_BH10PLA1_09980 [soil metagenome]
MILLVFALVLVATLSLYGWGRITRPPLRLPAGSWAATVVLGLAAVIFVGGVLNLFRIAYTPSLVGVVLVGVAAGIVSLRRDRIRLTAPLAILPKAIKHDASEIAGYVVIAAILCVNSIRLFTPRAYDAYDDLQKYFAHPVRMIETGTVYASPISALGSETMGAKAFLDGFVVAFFPFTYLNAVDGQLGMLICMLLIVQFAYGHPRLVGMTILSLVLFLIIDPLLTNITPIYLCAAMVLGILTFLISERERPSSDALPNPLAIGLLYSALLGLKITFGLFLVLQLAAAAAVVGWTTKSLLKGCWWGLKVSLSIGLFLLPWVLIHLPHYLAAIRNPYDTGRPPDSNAVYSYSLFSFETVGYPITMASYSCVLCASIIFTAIAVWISSKTRERSAQLGALMLLTCVIAASITYPVMVHILGPRLYGSAHSMRYFVPIVIALAPASLCIASVFLIRFQGYRHGRMVYMAMLALAVLAGASFKVSIIDRLNRLVAIKSPLAYSALMHRVYLDYIDSVFDGRMEEKIKLTQGLIPPGEPILAWINAPFYLDYARNPIEDVDMAGLTTSWARIPRAKYLMWDYAGFPTFKKNDISSLQDDEGEKHRLRAVRTLTTIDRFIDLVQKGTILYDDHSLIVVKLNETDEGDSAERNTLKHVVIQHGP